MIIRKALPKDVEKINESYDELFLYEKEYGSFSQWEQNVYPTREYAQKCTDTGQMYVLEDTEEICASMILNREQAPEYRDIQWRYEADVNRVTVIHTLCIPPRKARLGYGSKMLEFAKEYAAKEGSDVIRIDTNVKNEPAKRFYEKNGFLIAGEHHALHHGVIDTTLIYLEYRL